MKVSNDTNLTFIKGQEFKSRINKYIKEFEAFHTDILPFIRSAYGKNILDSYFVIIREAFPWYAEEIKVNAHFPLLR